MEPFVWGIRGAVKKHVSLVLYSMKLIKTKKWPNHMSHFTASNPYCFGDVTTSHLVGKSNHSNIDSPLICVESFTSNWKPNWAPTIHQSSRSSKHTSIDKQGEKTKQNKKRTRGGRVHYYVDSPTTTHMLYMLQRKSGQTSTKPTNRQNDVS